MHFQFYFFIIIFFKCLTLFNHYFVFMLYLFNILIGIIKWVNRFFLSFFFFFWSWVCVWCCWGPNKRTIVNPGNMNNILMRLFSHTSSLSSVRTGADSLWRSESIKSWVRMWTVCLSWLWWTSRWTWLSSTPFIKFHWSINFVSDVSPRIL